MTMPLDDPHASAPFEGPEKLLEIWFAPSANDVPDAALATEGDGRTGLRKIKREVWEEMLDIVQCKVLNVIEGKEMDAYLLSESSFFVSPHRLILKTCGTTLNLLGLPRILSIASSLASLPSVHRCFYSRKSFMFPERQIGPHRDWKYEVEYLDNTFAGMGMTGAAYTVGKVNGDHWLLYLTDTLPSSSSTSLEFDDPPKSEDDPDLPPHVQEADYTIEILMSHLSPAARAPFFFPDESQNRDQALALSSELGIANIFPPHLTTLDAYTFTPCGYSSNALLRWGEDATHPNKIGGEGYYTIHVTPEEGWSYASFECNVPLPTSPSVSSSKSKSIPDLKTLIRRVVDIFQPGRLSLTLFISSEDNSNYLEDGQDGQSAVESAQQAFRTALAPVVDVDGSDKASGVAGRGYRRTDKINYEFGGYDLAFASFELRA